MLSGEVKEEVENCIRMFSEQKRCTLDSMNVQPDHVHIILDVPPKVSISEIVGVLKGRTAIRIFGKYKKLKQRPYWGNHFWARGYCVDTIGLDAEMIRRYVQYQEKQEKNAERGNKQVMFNRGRQYLCLLWGQG